MYLQSGILPGIRAFIGENPPLFHAFLGLFLRSFSSVFRAFFGTFFAHFHAVFLHHHQCIAMNFRYLKSALLEPKILCRYDERS